MSRAYKIVRKIRTDEGSIPHGIADCCSECEDIAWESCFLRGQCRKYRATQPSPTPVATENLARVEMLHIDRRVADWLVAEGLAKARSWNDDGTYAGAGELIEITDAGREALR